ncbi:MAG TPA: YCF48-related protein [Saprospiraceae bacterium]|nr:YCF48-related protein [Saprospiraceae bacterium]
MKLFSSFLIVLLALPLCLFAQWDRQYPLEKLEQVLDIAVAEDGYGFAVGSNDLILKLDPGTNQWDLLLSWNKKWKLEGVDYLDGTEGEFAAAGGNGFIITENGGVNWTEIADAPTGIKAVKILSMTDIVVVATGGVFRWKDGTWEDHSPAASNLKDGFILDDQHIWVYTGGSTAKIYYTSNGGADWNENTEIDGPDVVVFYNALYGVASETKKIYITKDGGQHWILRSDGVINNTSADIAFGESPNVMISASLNNNPAISMDSGLTWVPKLTGLINTRSYSVATSDDEIFWLGNDLSTIALSDDAGDTWVESAGPTRSIIQDMHFLSRTVGFAVGNKGAILRTVDGGTNWVDLSKGDIKGYLAIHGLAANDLWIGTNQRVLHSTDMGENWTEKLLIAGGNFNDVLELTPTRILAVSSAGLIYRTTDGGANWDTVFTINGQLRSISKIDNQRLMATGYNGVILRSEDLGDTWHSVTIPEAGNQYEQAFFLGNDGWLVTSSFKHQMWHTTNAGDSWDTITLPIDRFWDGVFFITPDTGIVVGHNTSEGRAYMTFNGGENWQAGYVVPFQLTGVAGVNNPNGTAWIYGNGSDIEVLPYCGNLPVVADFNGDIHPCEKDTVTYTVSSQDVENFYWTFPAGWTIIGNANNDTVSVKVGANPGTISVYAINICGFSGTLAFDATVDPLPTVSPISGAFVYCPGTQMGVATDGINADSYHWTYPSSWTVIGSSTAEFIVFTTTEEDGLISVYGINSCGNSEPASDIAIVYMIPSEAGEIQINGDTLSVANIAGLQYQWFLNGAPITGASGSTYIITQSGQYSVFVTSNMGCTLSGNSVDVIFSSTINPSITQGLKVNPSPADDLIQISGVLSGASYTIINSLGAVVQQNHYDGQYISVDELPSGLYMIVVERMVGRFVKL